MIKLIIFFISTIFCQDIISTKQFSVYVSNEDSYIDLSQYVNNMSGVYKINIISLDDLQWNNNNKKYYKQNDNFLEKSKKCELSFSISSNYNNQSSITEICDSNQFFGYRRNPDFLDLKELLF